MISNALKQRFIKDYGLPIHVYEDVLFDYYIQELDEQFNTIEKYNNFKNLLSKYKKEELFFQESSDIINNIISFISNKEDYKKLSNDNLNNYNQVKDIQSKDIYNLTNVGNYYISIDLVKANFQALKRYSKDLVLEANNYNDFIKNFTNENYFINSKQIRQVIFGNLLPKKQQIIQKDIMFDLYNLLKARGINDNQIVSVMPDEIIIKCIDKKNMDDLKNKIENEIFKNIDYEIRIEAYKLNSIQNRKFFVKEFDNNKIELKCVPANLYLQAYKTYLNRELKDEDLMFFQDGVLAKYLNPIFDLKNINEKDIKIELDR